MRDAREDAANRQARRKAGLLCSRFLTEDNNLGQFVDPAVKTRNFAHPHDADHFLDLPHIIFEPGLPSLQAANVGLQAADVGLQPGDIGFDPFLPGLDRIDLGQKLEQEGLEVVHRGVPLVELASYMSTACASMPTVPRLPADTATAYIGRDVTVQAVVTSEGWPRRSATRRGFFVSSWKVHLSADDLKEMRHA